MIYGSVCSGIEAATCAWHSLGWEPAFFSEIEDFPRAVLAHHYPNVPCHGDFTTITADNYGTIDLLVGGTPCQSFSIAGLRAGMADHRGNLALEFIKLAGRKRPRWVVWENVPGVFSSSGGTDFGSFLEGLTGRTLRTPEEGWQNSGIIEGIPEAYGLAWRVIDAQYCGVPQRRRRVFVVGHLGDWRPAAAVLFERHSLQGHSPPRRKTGKGTTHNVAPSLVGSGRGTERAGDTRGQDPVVAVMVPDTEIAHSLRGEGFDASEDGTGRGTPLIAARMVAFGEYVDDGTASALKQRDYKDATDLVVTPFDTTQVTSQANRSNPKAGDPCHPLAIVSEPTGWPAEIASTLSAAYASKMGLENQHIQSGASLFVPAIAFPQRMSATQCASTEEVSPVLQSTNPTAICFQSRIGRNGRGQPSEIVPALNGANAGDTSDMRPLVATTMAVRRLTPRECERLQGFPDDFTLIAVRGKPATDSPRYKALGNSMAVPVMRWIGERIQMVDSIHPANQTTNTTQI